MGQAKNSKKKMDNQEPVKKDDEAKRLERLFVYYYILFVFNPCRLSWRITRNRGKSI